jgi:hypothetical protein
MSQKLVPGKEFPGVREHWIRPDFREKESRRAKLGWPDRTVEPWTIAMIAIIAKD